jgi:hypothetical protein
VWKFNVTSITFDGEVQSFVILDDDDDMGDLLPRLVHCKNYSGLTDERREEAIRMLNDHDRQSGRNEP